MADRPIIFSGPMVRALIEGRKTQTRRVMKPYDKIPGTFRSLYKPGDRLWVRETWRTSYTNDYYVEALGRTPRASDLDPEATGIEYLADGENELSGKTRAAIHMPRWASRLTLIVEEVRVQRLQDISEPDVWAEGLSINPGPPGYAQEEFAELWNSLHGPEAWAANPWVAALTFRVERANIDTL